MNTAIILAGGIGTRLGGEKPKQYLDVAGKPVICYCLDKFQNSSIIDEIIIVASVEWQSFIKENIINISKFKGFALAGSSRQHSVLNGLKAANPKTEKVIIHDAARPNVSINTITQCINGLDDYDGVMPVIGVKDTIYYSEKGDEINSLLNRDKLFAGQSPESFKYKQYMHIHEGLSENELSLIRGSSEIAFNSGLKIKIINGDEHNYKITTVEDLERFKSEVIKEV